MFHTRRILNNPAAMPQKQVLYALLIGIDAYTYPVPALRGCVRDVLAFKKYLEEEWADRFELRLELLCNAEATVERVVNRIEQHLGLAAEGDVALLYYAGHGAQERADAVLWPAESDGLLEGLVCYDSIPAYGHTYHLLSDKELRYLIHRVAHGVTPVRKAIPPHVLTIFDCCHSGGNTRYSLAGEKSPMVLVRRFSPLPPRSGEARLGMVLPARKWHQFIFSATISEEDMRAGALPDVLPEGLHVQLAACGPDESAYETGGSGVFSQNLLQVLRRTDGNISYYELRNRLYHFIKNQFPQSPQLHVGGGKAAAREVYRGFLGAPTQDSPLYGNVVYNRSAGWIMDLGAIHGIADGTGQVVQIVEAGKAFPRYSASIRAVRVSETLLGVDAATDAILQQGSGCYRGYWDSVRWAPLRIFILDLDGQAELAAGFQAAIAGAHRDHLQVIAHRAEADYLLCLDHGFVFISPPQLPLRPLVLPIRRDIPEAISLTLDYLRHIARWEQVKKMKNEEPGALESDAVVLEIKQTGTDGRLLDLTGAGDTLSGEPTSGYRGGVMLRMAVRNTSSFPLYASLLCLSASFEVSGSLLNGKVVRLDASGSGDTALVFEGSDIPLPPDKSLELGHFPYSVYFFKLLFSRQEFTVDTLELEALPDPMLLGHPIRGQGSSGGGGYPSMRDWGSRLIALRIPHPYYQNPPVDTPGWWERGYKEGNSRTK